MFQSFQNNDDSSKNDSFVFVKELFFIFYSIIWIGFWNFKIYFVFTESRLNILIVLAKFSCRINAVYVYFVHRYYYILLDFYYTVNRLKTLSTEGENRKIFGIKKLRIASNASTSAIRNYGWIVFANINFYRPSKVGAIGVIKIQRIVDSRQLWGQPPVVQNIPPVSKISIEQLGQTHFVLVPTHTYLGRPCASSLLALSRNSIFLFRISYAHRLIQNLFVIRNYPAWNRNHGFW